MLAATINGWARRVPAWPIYIAGAALPAWLLWQAASGAMGADPVKGLEKTLGLWALKLIVAGLCITPLRRMTGVSLLKYRRAIGLMAFFYVLAHLAVWISLDLGFRWDLMIRDLTRRTYLIIGIAGFLMLVPLALTSNNWSVRRLGAAAWQKLHRLTYAAAALAGLHYVWLNKTWSLRALAYMAAILALLGLRAIWSARRGRAPLRPARLNTAESRGATP